MLHSHRPENKLRRDSFHFVTEPTTTRESPPRQISPKHKDSLIQGSSAPRVAYTTSPGNNESYNKLIVLNPHEEERGNNKSPPMKSSVSHMEKIVTRGRRNTVGSQTSSGRSVERKTSTSTLPDRPEAFGSSAEEPNHNTPWRDHSYPKPHSVRWLGAGYMNGDTRPAPTATKLFSNSGAQAHCSARQSSLHNGDADENSSPPSSSSRSQEGRWSQRQASTPWKFASEYSPFYLGPEGKSSSSRPAQSTDSSVGHSTSRYATLRRFIPFRGGGIPPPSNKSSTDENINGIKQDEQSSHHGNDTTFSERIIDSAKSSLSRALKATINRGSFQTDDQLALSSSIKMKSPKCSTTQIIKAGVVNKWTNYYDKWRPRYFQVIPGALQYSEGESGPIKEQLALRYCAIRLRVNPGELDIIRPGQSNISLRFTSKEERAEWIKALTHAKQFLPLSTTSAWELDGDMASPAKSFDEFDGSRTIDKERNSFSEHYDMTRLANDILMPHDDLMAEIEPDTIPLVKLRNVLSAHEIEVRKTVDEIKRIEARFLQTLALIRHPTLGSKIKETAVSLIRQVDSLQACILSHLGVADNLIDEEQEERQVLQSSLRKIARENYKLGLRLQKIPRASAPKPKSHFPATESPIHAHQDEPNLSDSQSKNQGETDTIVPPEQTNLPEEIKQNNVTQGTESPNIANHPPIQEQTTVRPENGMGDDVFFDLDDELSSGGGPGKNRSADRNRRQHQVTQDSKSELKINNEQPFKESSKRKTIALNPSEGESTGVKSPATFAMTSNDQKETPDHRTLPVNTCPQRDGFDDDYDDDEDDDDDDEGADSSLSENSLPPDQTQTYTTKVSSSSLKDPTEEEYAAEINLGLKKPEDWKYRTKLPIQRTAFKMSIWSLLKDCVGKDLTRIALPVYFNEPTSFLQRMAEDFQYAWALEKVGLEKDRYKRLLWMAIFTVTPWASAIGRTYKPFNPLLGETYEIVHRGYRFQSEQVGHHPPTTAYHVEGANFESWGHIVLGTKFTGKSLEIAMQGTTNFRIHHPDGHYERFSSKRARMIVNNIIFGKISMDVAGTYVVTNHTTGDFAVIDFPKKGWWSSELHPVRGAIFSVDGFCHWRFSGVWSQGVEMQQVDPMKIQRAPPWVSAMKIGVSKELNYGNRPLDFHVDWNAVAANGISSPSLAWKPEKRPSYSDKYYEFGYMTFELNEISPLYDNSKRLKIPPTDSRYRPDQRALEEGEVERSNEEKQRLEEKQRAAARIRETETNYKPLWYQRQVDELTGNPVWIFDKRYWKARDNDSDPEEAKDLFRDCVDIF